MRDKAKPERLYAAWKADKIRARLNSYRISHAAGRELLPLSVVLERLAMSPATDPAMLKRSGMLAFPEEWLRRFTKGDGGLPFDRVDTIARFLIHEDFLAAEELEESTGDFGEMLALHGYLGSNAAAARAKLTTLPTPYVVLARTAYNTETIRLEFVPADTDGLLLAEESDISENKVLAGVPRVKDIAKRRLRKGYAFFSTRMNLLHVFLRGAASADRVHYIQVEPFILAADSLDVFLARVGVPWRGGESFFAAPRFRGGMATLENCGVLKFEAEPVLAPAKQRH